MKTSVQQHGKVTAILIFASVIAILSIFSFFYYNHTVADAAYISSNYDKIKIPEVFHLEKKTVSDTVPDDSSLPAQGNYTYSINAGSDTLQALHSLEDELIREGFNSTKIKTYRVNGSTLHVLNASNEQLYLDCRILSDTPENTMTSIDSNKLTVFAAHNSKD